MSARAARREGHRHHRRGDHEIAASLVRELEAVGAPYHAWVLEDLAPRPLSDLPQEILDDLETSQVSIFAVQAQANELHSRMQMTDVVNRRKIRHAHMVNINRQIMLEGMRADFLKVDRISMKVVEMLRKAKQIRAKTAAGTDLVADLNPNYQLAENQRHHQPRQMGQPAGWRSVHDSGRSQRNVRDRWRGGRLALRQVWQLARASADHSREGQSPGGSAFRRTVIWRAISGATPIPMRTAIASASLRSAPTSN